MLLSELKTLIQKAESDVRWSDTHFGEDRYDSASIISLHMAEARLLIVIASCLVEDLLIRRLGEEREEMRQARLNLESEEK